MAVRGHIDEAAAKDKDKEEGGGGRRKKRRWGEKVINTLLTKRVCSGVSPTAVSSTQSVEDLPLAVTDTLMKHQYKTKTRRTTKRRRYRVRK